MHNFVLRAVKVVDSDNRNEINTRRCDEVDVLAIPSGERHARRHGQATGCHQRERGHSYDEVPDTHAFPRIVG
ncbi:hypothetical protein LWC34_37665 [Kibdelosporangium philippinense]|uniref:Uncharacterized protein n=1 Tax=Kibdelosporangium philippinense TaxID=211113 RepID=A0ABS8ZLW2_9PSEU|nr:hypothetical protein [Kibdelosporangium philippinense]MCE7008499.1 hypothetical protein [Kibdelosporangium philippinense]